MNGLSGSRRRNGRGEPVARKPCCQAVPRRLGADTAANRSDAGGGEHRCRQGRNQCRPIPECTSEVGGAEEDCRTMTTTCTKPSSQLPRHYATMLRQRMQERQEVLAAKLKKVLIEAANAMTWQQPLTVLSVSRNTGTERPAARYAEEDSRR